MAEVAVRLNTTSLEKIATQATPQMMAQLAYTLLLMPSRGETCYYITENESRPFAEGRVVRGSDLRHLYTYNPDLIGGWFHIKRRT